MTENLKKFRSSIIIFASVCFVTYPILELLENLTDASNSEVVSYHLPKIGGALFIYGLSASVFLSFAYMAIRDWIATRSKIRAGVVMSLGVVASLVSYYVVVFLYFLIARYAGLAT